MRILFITYTLPIILAVCSCEPQPISQEISILLDQTEEQFTHISKAEFTAISLLTVNENNGERVRIQPITEFGFNNIKSFRIDAVENLLTSNDYEREGQIDNYFMSIDSVLAEIRCERKERAGSAIFKPLSEELNRLSESMADTKIVIVNSDLMEKSFIDFYSPKTYNQLKSSPNKIQDTLLKHYPLKKLDGIEINIIYKPQDKVDSEHFEIVSDFYKDFLESQGAKVHIGANLQQE